MELKVKICGITRADDARAAIEAGADFLGFIFARESPRCVTPAQVSEILNEVQPWRAGVSTVGVFVDQTPSSVVDVLAFCGLELAQLHGDEPPEVLGLSRNGATVLRGRAYKALRPRSGAEAGSLAASYALPAVARQADRLPAFLLDAWSPGRRGGTGRVSDWDAAARLAAKYPLLLAGGLSPANVAEAIRMVRPWGIDVSSGVEVEPGKKSPAAMRAFVAAAKSTWSEVTYATRK